MVLQPSNKSNVVKKRVSAKSSENIPPIKLRTVSSSLKDASRRRRARVAGNFSTTSNFVTNKQAYAQHIKKRKMKPSSSKTLRFGFDSFSIPIQDVEMKDIQPVAHPIVEKTTVQLPRHLARPDYKEISRETLATIDPELVKTPIEYIHDGLAALGPEMYKVLGGVKPAPLPASPALPQELAIMINDLSSEMPSHMLAVYSSQTNDTVSNRRSKVTLYPSHNIILAAHCASLPPLRSITHPAPKVAGSSITVPVVPLCIPAAELYAPLSMYLYTKRADLLLRSLLPVVPPTPINVYTSPDETPEEAARQHNKILSFARQLAATYTPHALLQYAMRVNGLWRNVCALGIFDSGIWETIDTAWEVLLLALGMATGNLDKVLGESTLSS